MRSLFENRMSTKHIFNLECDGIVGGTSMIIGRDASINPFILKVATDAEKRKYGNKITKTKQFIFFKSNWGDQEIIE